jgi:hypothetical protein
MPELNPELRTLRARGAAHKSWGNTQDRTARTAKARQALEDKFLTEAGGDPKRAESLRRAYYAQLAYKSVKARQRRAAPPSLVIPGPEPLGGGVVAPDPGDHFGGEA